MTKDARGGNRQRELIARARKATIRLSEQHPMVVLSDTPLRDAVVRERPTPATRVLTALPAVGCVPLHPRRKRSAFGHALNS